MMDIPRRRPAARAHLSATTEDAPVRAILGPTNTGKTHLALERMLAHTSGVMGFPLRLLARENYERMVKLKGVRSVALITGEEKLFHREHAGSPARLKPCPWTGVWILWRLMKSSSVLTRNAAMFSRIVC